LTFQYVNSLRSRYAAVAAVLIILVLAGALLAHQNVVDTRNETTANIEVRNRIHQTSRHIRDAVWQARESLEAFLLDPHGNAHREHIYASIGQAKRYTEQLARQPWIETHAQGPSITQLQRCLEELEKASENLIATRMDAIRQYPALGFARETMLPRHREFYTAATLAMDEILAEAPDDVRSSSYQSFVRARHLWTQMVSLFRMYLANRLGSFNESALRVQERDIETQYQGLTQELALLKNMSRGNKLGMQASASLDELVSTAEGWHKGFEEVRRINSSGEWRTDGKQIKQIIQPLLETIWGALVSLDVSIENSANQDVQALTRLAQTQTQTLWLLTVLGLVFIGAGFIALERSVLRPIATVAHALKTEASGGEVEILPQATSRETQDLVDAFAEMRNQVHNRQLALEHQALHDALTNLPNRSLLLDRLQQAIYSARRQNSFLALFMMDLDRFKEINDTLGHQVGDSLLKEVGARLLATLRQTDTVARLGGDEFALLLPATDVDNAKSIAVKTLAALEQVFKVDDHHLYVSASIGIAVYPQHGATAQMLVQRADVAMYVAKRSKIDYAVYDREQDQHSVGRLALMSDLR
jgi:diguanylate cyclase (GGDEF)-like protein